MSSKEHRSPTQPSAHQSDAAAKFLDSDFTQCFQHLRHVDAQSLDITKFAFTADSTILGAGGGLVVAKPEYSTVAVALFAVGALLGLCLLSIEVRNRALLVLLVRYINSHRRHFLRLNNLGFANVTGMFEKPTMPKFFNCYSSNALQIYALALLNAVLIGSVALVLSGMQSQDLRRSLWVAGAASILQIGMAIGFLLVAEWKASHPQTTEDGVDAVTPLPE